MTKDKESRPTFKTCPEKVKKAVLENRERLQSVPEKTLQRFENHVIEHVDSELACLDKLKSLKISPRRTTIWESILFDRCIAIWGTKPFTNREEIGQIVIQTMEEIYLRTKVSYTIQLGDPSIPEVAARVHLHLLGDKANKKPEIKEV